MGGGGLVCTSHRRIRIGPGHGLEGERPEPESKVAKMKVFCWSDVGYSRGKAEHRMVLNAAWSPSTTASPGNSALPPLPVKYCNAVSENP